MVDERDKSLLSEMVDGELSSDSTNDLLLRIIDDPDGREELKGMLRLRRLTSTWRNSQPARPILAERGTGSREVRARWLARPAGMAIAACFGGLVACLAFWVWAAVRPKPSPPIAAAPARSAPASPEQKRQVAEVFAFHESVTGPLAWYVDDDQGIQVGSARGALPAGNPIAVLLKMQPTSGHGRGRTFVVVCREQQPAVIDLPGDPSRPLADPPLRLRLSLLTVKDRIQMRYAISLGGEQREIEASVGGSRGLDAAQVTLGQLACGSQVFDVAAAAWPVAAN